MPPPPGAPLMAPKMNFPQPDKPVKSYNWVKQIQIKDTIFENMKPEEVLKKNINTKLLIESFSAKMTRASTRQTVVSDDTDKDAVQELKLIDSNRAQNFSIVLSR